MAEAETDTTEAPAKPAGGLKSKLIIGTVALVLIGFGAVVGPAALDRLSGAPADAPAESAEGATADVTGTVAATPAAGPALYQSLLPPLIVNIKDAAGDVHFMQLSMEVMARDQNVVNAIREHTTVIRNNLILLYGSESYESVITREGKEKLLADGLAEIRSIMRPHVGGGEVEALYFTALVVQ